MIVLAAGTMHVAVRMILRMVVGVAMRVRMGVLVVMVIMRMVVSMGMSVVPVIVVTMVVSAGAVVVGLALGAEGAGHGDRGAALAADEFRRHG